MGPRDHPGITLQLITIFLRWNWWFVVMTILACVIFRVIGVLLLSAIANLYRINKLSWTEQLIMMYGGLRGGVAFALVLLIDEGFAPHAKMFVTTTLAMVYWTVFFQVSWLIKHASCILSFSTRASPSSQSSSSSG